MSREPLRSRREQTTRDPRRTPIERRAYQTVAALHPPSHTQPSRADLTWRDRLARLTAGWDYPLLAILAIMLAYGLVMVFSASYATWGVTLFLKQIQWIGIGLVGMVAAASIPIRLWQRLAIPVMLVAVIALAAVLFFGDYRFGSRRTFSGSIQPSEFTKLAVILYVATWVTSKGRALADTRVGLIPFAILMGLVASLIALEPNMSTTIVVLSIGIVIFFVGGADIKQLLVVGLIGGVILGLLLWQTPHAQERILAWWNTLTDPELAPESTRRALELMQRRDGLVPDATVWNQKRLVALLWSDYLFANMGADLGPIGQLAAVALYAALGYRCLGIALRADGFGTLAIVGLLEVSTDRLEAYGYRRIQAAQRHRGFVVNHKIRRLMREDDLQARRRRRYVSTTDGDHELPVFPNLVKSIVPHGPNQLRVAVIPYVAMSVGFVYRSEVDGRSARAPHG